MIKLKSVDLRLIKLKFDAKSFTSKKKFIKLDEKIQKVDIDITDPNLKFTILHPRDFEISSENTVIQNQNKKAFVNNVPRSETEFESRLVETIRIDPVTKNKIRCYHRVEDPYDY